MAESERSQKKRTQLRKRVAKVVRFPFAVKQIAWRITASCFWLYGIIVLCGGRGPLDHRLGRVLSAVSSLLTVAGFAPSSPIVLGASCGMVWLLGICGFSWAQLIGFFTVYLPLSPLLLVFRAQRKSYRERRAEAILDARRRGRPTPRLRSTFALVTGLITWFALYGHTSQQYPLIVAMVLTGLLFASRVSRALAFAAPIEPRRWPRVEGFAKSAGKFILQSFEDIRAGNISELRQLSMRIRTASWFLRVARRISTWLHGGRAKKRAALIVLVQFMWNLASLGGLSILFWALAIRSSFVPAYSGMGDALLASAAHAIPGVPDSSSLHVNVWIQALASVSAWLIFVLYAGPVASLFPAFQERVIAQTSEEYKRIRTVRKSIAQFVDVLKPIQRLVLDHPELEVFAKIVILLRKQTDLRAFLLSQPVLTRSLASKPTDVGLLRSLGVPIPDLDIIVRELPPELGEVSGARSQAVHSDSISATNG